MSLDLNLLPSEAKFRAKKMKLAKKAKKIAIISMAVWMGIMVVVFAADQWFNWMTVREDKKALVLESQLANLSQELKSVLKIKYQVKAAGNLLSERFEYGRAFLAVKNLFNQEKVVIKDFQLKGKAVALSGAARNLTSIDEVESTIYTINTGESDVFSKAELESITFSPNDGSWLFSLNLYFK